jgi:hypothetical protein
LFLDLLAGLMLFLAQQEQQQIGAGVIIAMVQQPLVVL